MESEMDNFKRVLSDGWLPLEFQSGNEMEVSSVIVNKTTLKSIMEQVEQAILAKLAEQEPVAYLYADEVYGSGDSDINDYIRANGTPLYAHPIPETKEHHRTAKNHIPDASKMVGSDHIPDDGQMVQEEKTLAQHQNEFEKWANEYFGLASDGYELNYKNELVKMAWIAWKAARGI